MYACMNGQSAALGKHNRHNRFLFWSFTRPSAIQTRFESGKAIWSQIWHFCQVLRHKINLVSGPQRGEGKTDLVSGSFAVTAKLLGPFCDSRLGRTTGDQQSVLPMTCEDEIIHL